MRLLPFKSLRHKLKSCEFLSRQIFKKNKKASHKIDIL